MSRRVRRVWLPLACLCFTGADVVRADPTTFSPSTTDYVEDPYAPHVTDGTSARVGTAVGFIYGERQDVTALGLTAALGHRFGRFTVEAELDALSYMPYRDSGTRLGDGERLGVIGRFDVVRLDSHVVGANSLLSIYVEGGAAVAWNHWYLPTAEEPQRMVPDDSKRVELQAGFGVMLDHRLQEPIAFPRRIGWFLGWRMAFAPHETETASICRGTSCRVADPMPEDSYIDRAMLFQSSLQFTW
jgi:hypothetical protein